MNTERQHYVSSYLGDGAEDHNCGIHHVEHLFQNGYYQEKSQGMHHRGIPTVVAVHSLRPIQHLLQIQKCHRATWGKKNQTIPLSVKFLECEIKCIDTKPAVLPLQDWYPATGLPENQLILHHVEFTYYVTTQTQEKGYNWHSGNWRTLCNNNM